MMTNFVKHSVDLVVNSITPSTDLNPMGEDDITIDGSGFASRTDLDASVISLTFDDGSICKLLSSTATQMVCRTSRFDATYAPARRELTETAFGFVSTSRIFTVAMGT